ncbi:MAG: REP-associated tyrosine transposase [Bacillota bacterium]
MGDIMPRYARKQSKSGIYHIIIRGNERKEIFYDDDDRIRFLETLNKMKADGNYDIYAYCLMNNHVHLLIKEGKDSLQRSMKRICVSYVYYFNNKYQRIGHLFQDRFRSEAVEEESYLLAAARYIHNNPVKAGMVTKAEDFKWSSYKEYISTIGSNEVLVERGFLLSILSHSEERAIEIFKEISSKTVSDDFMEYEGSTDKTPIKDPGIKDLKYEIDKVLKNRGYSLESLKSCRDRKIRNELIREIKETTGASVRELSRHMGISKDIVFRA